MICRQARALLIDRELGLLGPERYAALHRHLQGCPGCRTEAHAGERLVGDLALLRGEVPFEVDVRPRVMARVAALGRPATDELPLRQTAIYAVAALLGGVAILVALWDLLPGLVEPARSAALLLSSARDIVAGLAASIAGLLAIPFKLLGTLLRSIGSMAPLVERLSPLGVAATVVFTGSMSLTVVYFVGRDLRGRPLQDES